MSEVEELVRRLTEKRAFTVVMGDLSRNVLEQPTELELEAAATITRLSEENAALRTEVARLKDRMSDMMPIAGGNPMKNTRSHGVSSTQGESSHG